MANKYKVIRSVMYADGADMIVLTLTPKVTLITMTLTGVILPGTLKRSTVKTAICMTMNVVAVYSKKQRNVRNLKERRTNGTVKYF